MSNRWKRLRAALAAIRADRGGDGCTPDRRRRALVARRRLLRGGIVLGRRHVHGPVGRRTAFRVNSDQIGLWTTVGEPTTATRPPAAAAGWSCRTP